MKLGLVYSVLLLGFGLAGVPESTSEGPPLQCEDGTRFHMQEVDRPDIEYSIRSVVAPADRHFFIQSPPLPDLSERFCNPGWLHEITPDSPLEWFDLGPDSTEP